jgi:hypothetical protein
MNFRATPSTDRHIARAVAGLGQQADMVGHRLLDLGQVIREEQAMLTPAQVWRFVERLIPLDRVGRTIDDPERDAR